MLSKKKLARQVKIDLYGESYPEYESYKKKKYRKYVNKAASERVYKPIKAAYGFIDELSAERKKGRKKAPFGKLKDRSLMQGFF